MRKEEHPNSCAVQGKHVRIETTDGRFFTGMVGGFDLSGNLLLCSVLPYYPRPPDYRCPSKEEVEAFAESDQPITSGMMQVASFSKSKVKSMAILKEDPAESTGAVAV